MSVRAGPATRAPVHDAPRAGDLSVRRRGRLGGEGVFIGRDASGGAFCFDPWVLYGDGALDDPNAIVLGKLGQGKSALVKTLLWRMLLFGAARSCSTSSASTGRCAMPSA